MLWVGVLGCRPDANPGPNETTAAPASARSSAKVQPPAEAKKAAETTAVEPAMPAPPAVPATSTETATPATPDSQEATATPATNAAAAVPLVDHPEALTRLQPDQPVWFDNQERQVVLVGTVCQNHVPLEMFACLRGTKEHESVLSIDTRASVVHAGLLAAGAVPGQPVQYQPDFVAAHGPEIEVTLVWQDAHGQRQQARGQDWVREARTGRAMPYPWVFGGSKLLKDAETGKEFYLADGEGDLICVSNFPSAVLDIPVQSTDANANLLFEAFTEHIPPVGTAVTLLLKPKLPANAAPAASPKPTGPGA